MYKVDEKVVYIITGCSGSIDSRLFFCTIQFAGRFPQIRKKEAGSLSASNGNRDLILNLRPLFTAKIKQLVNEGSNCL
jgi:hypothetical protein